jgi:hypothetical protein
VTGANLIFAGMYLAALVGGTLCMSAMLRRRLSKRATGALNGVVSWLQQDADSVAPCHPRKRG